MYHINMRIEWNQDKNNLLKESRGVSCLLGPHAPLSVFKLLTDIYDICII